MLATLGEEVTDDVAVCQDLLGSINEVLTLAERARGALSVMSAVLKRFGSVNGSQVSTSGVTPLMRS